MRARACTRMQVSARLSGDDVLGMHKKRRLDKAGRMDSVLAGREGREDAWKDRWEKKKQAGGLRNDQAKKNKVRVILKLTLILMLGCVCGGGRYTCPTRFGSVWKRVQKGVCNCSSLLESCAW